MATNTPFITVVMPVRNEARFIADTLDQLLTQDYPADCFEIIVADGMSDDGTREIVSQLAEKHPQVRLLVNPARLSSAGRNVGFRAGQGEYFVVVDGHCYIPTDRFLRNHADCFEQSKAYCLARPQPLDPPGLTPFQQAVALARASRLGHGGGSLIYSDFEGFAIPQSNGAAYSRVVFDQVGYVDERFDACEDVEFNFRVEKAGLLSFMSPRLAVKYYPRESLGSLFRQMVRYGAGRYRLFRKHPETLGGSTLVPPLFALCVLITIPAILATLLGFLPTWLSFLPVLGLLAYAGLVVLQSVLICLQSKVAYCWVLPAVFFVIHFGLGWGFLRAALARSA